MKLAIEAEGLYKRFFKQRPFVSLLRRPFAPADQVDALRGVDLQVRQGEIFALLGPNGAGKTTLLKILSCLVLPDRGTARLDGIDIRDEYRVKPRLGLVHSDERSFYWRLSARQNLRFFARLYNVPAGQVDQRIDTLLEQFGLTAAADRAFSGFSSGMKQRVAIARAMLHDPPVLLMDEPTRSLDPAAARKLREFVLDRIHADLGKTILLASHNLGEVEKMADRVAIVVDGVVRQVGTTEEVKRWGLEGQRFRIEIATVGDSAVPDGPYRVLSDRTEEGRRRIELATDSDVRLNDVLGPWFAAGIDLRACDRLEPDLEDAFARVLDDSSSTNDAGGASS